MDQVYAILRSHVPSAPPPGKRKAGPEAPAPTPATELAALRATFTRLALNEAFTHSVPLRLAMLEAVGYETDDALDALGVTYKSNRSRARTAKARALAGGKPPKRSPARVITSDNQGVISNDNPSTSAKPSRKLSASGNASLKTPATIVLGPTGNGHDTDTDTETLALDLLKSLLGAEVIAEHTPDGRCDARGCTEPPRDCGSGEYCQRHAKMLGATWPEVVIPAAAA